MDDDYGQQFNFRLGGETAEVWEFFARDYVFDPDDVAALSASVPSLSLLTEFGFSATVDAPFGFLPDDPSMRELLQEDWHGSGTFALVLAQVENLHRRAIKLRDGRTMEAEVETLDRVERVLRRAVEVAERYDAVFVHAPWSHNLDDFDD